MREEGHAGLAGDGPGQQRLAGARRPDQQHAARDARAERVELLRVLEELDDFLELRLGLVDAGHVVERDVGLLPRNIRARLLPKLSAWLLVPWAWRIMKKMKPPMRITGRRPVRSRPSHEVSGALTRL